jgi:HSP20 family protein
MPRDRILSTLCLHPADDAADWRPPLDIYELRDGWLLKADAAGVRPEDITVTLAGRRVTIRGLRRDWTVEEGCCHYRMEISYSRFERTVELPGDPDPAAVQTEYRDGMLLVRLRQGHPTS